MSQGFTAPKGIPEYYPPRSDLYVAVRQGLAAPALRAGYSYIELPLFEDTQLYARGVGESTDVVTKEMYTFTDRGGRSVSLRPELTAGLLRSVLEHDMYRGQLPLKLWTVGPCFRYERPQAGRYRAFHQMDIEAIGTDDPAIDAEVIALGWDAYRGLGLTRQVLLLNSLGCRQCRPAYRQRLQEFLRGLDLDADTRRRTEINPMRVLDDKRPEVIAQLGGAPLITDHLCPACREHHDAVRGFLADLSIPWTDEPRLVRGLDYYTRTTFEFQHGGLGAQAALGGGGRYDGLSEDIGGPPLPGIGFGLGVDRTLLAVEAEGVDLGVPARCRVFFVPLGDQARRATVGLLSELRRAGVSADMAYGGRGLKGAMKAADRSGASHAVILGERDLSGGVAQLKDLASGEQAPVPLTDLVTTLREKLS